MSLGGLLNLAQVSVSSLKKGAPERLSEPHRVMGTEQSDEELNTCHLLHKVIITVDLKTAIVLSQSLLPLQLRWKIVCGT